jgi:hypothetical protein
MQTMRDQRLRMRDPADDNLGNGQRQIERRRKPGNAVCLAVTLWVERLGAGRGGFNGHGGWTCIREPAILIAAAAVMGKQYEFAAKFGKLVGKLAVLLMCEGVLI